MPTPSPESSTAPALPLRLLLLDRSCCSPDRAPLRRRVHPPAPRCHPRCPSRAPGGTFRHARASPRAHDRAKIPRPRAPPQLTGPLRTHPRHQIPALNRLSALTSRSNEDYNSSHPTEPAKTSIPGILVPAELNGLAQGKAQEMMNELLRGERSSWSPDLENFTGSIEKRFGTLFKSRGLWDALGAPIDIGDVVPNLHKLDGPMIR